MTRMNCREEHSSVLGMIQVQAALLAYLLSPTKPGEYTYVAPSIEGMKLLELYVVVQPPVEFCCQFTHTRLLQKSWK